MSFPEYKDFDSVVKGVFEEGFDTTSGLEINAVGPFDVGLTTKTALCCGTSVLPSTLSLKYANPCGFTIDNLEFASLDAVQLQTSFEPKVFSGVKLAFASVKTGGGNLGVVYKHKLATITTDLDVGNFSSLQSSVFSGVKGVQVGCSVDFSLKNKEFIDYSAGLAWVPKEGLFAGIQANDKFGAVSTSLQYQASPKLNVATLIEFAPKAVSESMKVAVGAEYAYCSGLTFKAKTNNVGIVNASVKKTLDNITLNGSVEINSKDLTAFNFGVNTTIG